MSEIPRFNHEAFRNVALKLNPNVSDPTGVRKALVSGCYPDIFKALRPLPYRVQEKLLVQGYGNPELGIPNGENLGRFLTRVNNIDWFNPNEEVDNEFIEERVEQAQDRLGVPKKKPLIIKGWENFQVQDLSWVQRFVFRNIKEVMGGIPWDKDLFAYRDAAFQAAFGINVDAIRKVGWVDPYTLHEEVAHGAFWIIVEDVIEENTQYKKGNPITPLIDMYEKGLWPVGQTKENFLILHPEVEGAS